MKTIDRPGAVIQNNNDGTVTKIKYKKFATDTTKWLDLYNRYRNHVPELVEILDFKVNADGTSFITMPLLNLKGDFFKVYEKSNEDDRILLAQNYYSLLNRLILSGKQIRNLDNKNSEEYFFHRDLFIYNILVDEENNLRIVDPDSTMFIRKDIIISQISTNFSLLTSLIYEK